MGGACRISSRFGVVLLIVFCLMCWKENELLQARKETAAHNVLVAVNALSHRWLFVLLQFGYRHSCFGMKAQ